MCSSRCSRPSGADSRSVRHETPRELALRILALSASDAAAHPDLEPFQTEALARLRAILDRHGGAILADSVGLGKTHVAIALIREALAAGGTVVIAAPAALRAHWTRHLRGMRGWRWLSHTALSRGAPAPRVPATLVVVDEAHAFRNHATRRYAALATLCERSRVLLLTATPVNNSLLDFQHLVHLFAARDAFIDSGVPDLDAAVESALRGGSSAELGRVADAIMVRRTRGAIGSGASTGRLRFPQCSPLEQIRYEKTHTDLIERVLHVVPRLRFAAHGSGDGAAGQLMRIGLLKRLESSPAALLASIRRHIRLLEQFVRAADAGLLFQPRTDIGIVDIGTATQLSFDALTLPPWPAVRDRSAALAAAESDMCALRALLPLTTARRADPKLARLRELLDTELADDTVLLFTEYRETARALWRSLAMLGGIAMVHGSDARLGRGTSTRRAIVDRFAPIANHARTPRAAERVRLLIATDVLAEGLNLQDARVVISYDIPWNPVRLAQRIGRIDRLGSPHPHIRALTFVPDRGLDDLLGLMRRLRRKLRHIRIIGGDAPWSLGRSRQRAVITAIDAIAEARAAAHARCRDLTPTALTIARTASAPDVPLDAASPAFAQALWSEDHDAVLCCFRIGGDTRLVLTTAERPPDIDAADCWTALRAALDSPDISLSGDEPRLEAAVRAARRALRPRAQTPIRPGRGAALAGAAVLRWLHGRPGGPAPDELRTADLLLRRLNGSSRAGTDVRLDQLVRTATSDADLVRELTRLRDDPAERSRRDTETAVLVGVLALVAATPQTA